MSFVFTPMFATLFSSWTSFHTYYNSLHLTALSPDLLELECTHHCHPSHLALDATMSDYPDSIEIPLWVHDTQYQNMSHIVEVIIIHGGSSGQHDCYCPMNVLVRWDLVQQWTSHLWLVYQEDGFNLPSPSPNCHCEEYVKWLQGF
jgi:hypothetical protein